MALDSTTSLSEGRSVEDVGGIDRELKKNYTLQSTSTGETLAETKEPLQQFSDLESVEAESVNASMETVALKALHVDDDATLNPWTFRVFFLGWSIFGLLKSTYNANYL